MVFISNVKSNNAEYEIASSLGYANRNRHRRDGHWKYETWPCNTKRRLTSIVPVTECRRPPAKRTKSHSIFNKFYALNNRKNRKKKKTNQNAIHIYVLLDLRVYWRRCYVQADYYSGNLCTNGLRFD